MSRKHPDKPGSGDSDGGLIRGWNGPGLLADFRPEAERPLIATEGRHALGGFEVPYLPEPFGDEGAGGIGAEGHRQSFLREMRRMVRGLYAPETWRGPAWRHPVAVSTYDLRLVSQPGDRGPGRVRIFILVKTFMPYDGGLAPEELCLFTSERGLAACRHCRAVAPRSLTLRPIVWNDVADEGKGVAARGDVSLVSPEDVGLAGDYPVIAELRPKCVLTVGQQPKRYEAFCASLERADDARVLPAACPWPLSDHSMLASASVMATAPTALVLSMRVQPTLKTRLEHSALIRRMKQLGRISKLRHAGSSVAIQRVLKFTRRKIASQEFFQVSVQVAGEDRGAVEGLLTTFAAERVVEETDRGDAEQASWSPVRLPCLNEHEQAIAGFNLSKIEFWPWGAVNSAARLAAEPDGGGLADAPHLGDFAPPEELRDPDVFLRRDLEQDPNLSRIRSLLSIAEAASVWRVPVVEPGGQAGLASRFLNPFEQVPVELPADPNLVELGLVRHRGVTTRQVYRVPLMGYQAGQAGIGDRVVVVAGSPGSGKTNFVLNLLAQYWDTREEGA